MAKQLTIGDNAALYMYNTAQWKSSKSSKSSKSPEESATFHSRFAPSASARWMTCTASIPLIEELLRTRQLVPREEHSSIHSANGTAMHSAGEFVLADPQRHGYRDAIGFKCPDTEIVIDEKMAGIVEEYVDTIRQKQAEDSDGDGHTAELFLERRFHLHEQCSGSVDATIISPRKLSIQDLKTGRGHFVQVKGNYQLGIYAAAAYKELGDFFDFDTIEAGIIQPPLSNTRHVLYVPDELRKIEEEVVEVIDRTDSGKTEFMPSEDACRWCAARPLCPALNRDKVSRAVRDFGTVLEIDDLDPDLTSDDQNSALLANDMDWGDRLKLAGMLELWIKAVKEETTGMLYNDQVPAGDSLADQYKVVTGKAGNRVWIDDKSLAKLARKYKLKKAEITATIPLGPAKIEKALKPKLPTLKGREIKEIVGKYCMQPPGGKTIVPIDDPREALNSTAGAIADFTDVE